MDFHSWVRGEDKKLSSLKYNLPEKFTNENDGVMSMHHMFHVLKWAYNGLLLEEYPVTFLLVVIK